MSRKRLFKFLLILSIILLAGNILIGMLFKNSRKNTESKPLDVSRIENIFSETLKEFGIEDNWITLKKTKPADNDSLTKIFTVSLPADLPIPLLLKSLKSNIKNKDALILNEEEKINGPSSIKIFSGGYLKLKAQLKYDIQLKRNRSKIMLIIIGFKNLTELLSVTYPITIALMPSADSEIEIKRVIEANQDYTVLLGDEINEPNYKLDKSFDTKRLASAVKAISAVFQGTRYAVYDDRSEIASSAVFNFVADRFKDQNKKLIPFSGLKDLTTSDIDEVKSLLKFYCETGDTDSVFPLLISDENYLGIIDQIAYFKRRGNTFITAREATL